MNIAKNNMFDTEIENALGCEIPTGDILILAGDVFSPCYLTESADNQDFYSSELVYEFFELISKKFKNVYFIPGNHEFYNGRFDSTPTEFDLFFSDYENISVLSYERFIFLDEIAIFGDTFWFDANNRNPITQFKIKEGMNDFHKISSPISDRKLMVETVIDHNFAARIALDEFMEECKVKNLFPIVITHHAPSFQMCVDDWRKYDEVSFGYANTGLDNKLMYDYPKHIWIHGHTHRRYELKNENFTICCNPRGYVGYERIANDFFFKELKIG